MARTYSRQASQPYSVGPETVVCQLKRRQEAARRLPAYCGCGARDPILCRCGRTEELTENAVDGWRATIELLLPIGPPIVPVQVLRQLWRNGGSDQVLAERVWMETSVK